MKRLRGFTLVEMIMVIVITGIIAGMVAVFIATPVTGYVDSVRRAGLTDVADLALKRMALEIRTAVPNSVQVTASNQIEFIPARTGGRYCTDTDTGCNALLFGGSDDSFDVLGTTTDAAVGEFIVVYNTGQTGLNAYAGDNLRTVATGTTTTAITFSGAGLTYASPSNRFQVVGSTGPVMFRCSGTELRRYDSYGWTHTTTGTGSLLASNVDCANTAFSYSQVSARNGLLTLRLTISSQGESVTLFHQIHVDNTP